MAELTPQFSTNRMLREYVEGLYLPALQKYLDRVDKQGQKAVRFRQWHDNIQKYWSQLRFGKLEIDSGTGFYNFRIPVYLGGLNPDFVAVQVYADPESGEMPENHPMIKGTGLAEINSYLFHLRINTHRPAGHYTPRIVPYFEGVALPLEAREILWYDASAGGI